MQRMGLVDFVALYRGRTVAEAELVAVSAEQHLVRRFFTELLGDEPGWHPETSDTERRPSVLEAARGE
jgi:hypothetical protein